MDLIYIIIIIVLAYLLYKCKKKNGKDFVDTANKYGDAFSQAASVFKNKIQEKQEDSFSSDNLFINDVLNPSYIIDPSKKDDEEFYKVIESYNENEKELKAWGPFNYDGTFDTDTQINVIPHKKYWIFIRSNKNEMKKLFKFNKINPEESSSHTKLLEAKELRIYVKVYKLKKKPVRWMGWVDLQFDDSTIHAGTVASNTQHQMWENLKLFINTKLETYDNQIEAYEDFSD